MATMRALPSLGLILVLVGFAPAARAQAKADPDLAQLADSILPQDTPKAKPAANGARPAAAAAASARAARAAAANAADAGAAASAAMDASVVPDASQAVDASAPPDDASPPPVPAMLASGRPGTQYWVPSSQTVPARQPS